MFYLQRAAGLLVYKKQVQRNNLTLRNVWKQRFTQRSGRHRTKQSKSNSWTSVSRSLVLVQQVSSRRLWSAFFHLNWRHKSRRHEEPKKMVQEADKSMKGSWPQNDRSSERRAEDGLSGRTCLIHQELNMQQHAGLWEHIETRFMRQRKNYLR